MTGLYPESHGITGNTVYDPSLDLKAKLTRISDTQWWNLTDPIWLTAKRQGLKTASSFWLGNDVYPRNPDIFLDYATNYSLSDRIDELVDWFKKFDLDFGCMYFDEPDKAGRAFGPDGGEYESKMSEMDAKFGYLVQRLCLAGVYERMNVLVVSDHGMARLNEKTANINLKDVVSLEIVDLDKSVLGEVSNIYPKTDRHVSIRKFWCQ